MKSFKWQLIGLQIIWEKVIDNQPARPQLHMSLLTNYPPPTIISVGHPQHNTEQRDHLLKFVSV